MEVSEKTGLVAVGETPEKKLNQDTSQFSGSRLTAHTTTVVADTVRSSLNAADNRDSQRNKPDSKVSGNFNNKIKDDHFHRFKLFSPSVQNHCVRHGIVLRRETRLNNLHSFILFFFLLISYLVCISLLGHTGKVIAEACAILKSFFCTLFKEIYVFLTL